ncbi:MAG: DUF4142 domain-containing protein [Gammaproteobacteria bacterium]
MKMRSSGMAVTLATALVMAATAAPSAWAAKPAGADFIRTSIRGNLAEMAVGRLAEERGSTPRVKALGATLAKDHAAANLEAVQAAQSLGVKAPRAPDPAQKAAYRKLAALSGPKFDEAFVKRMVADHHRDIALYGREVDEDDNAAGVYAKEALPRLRQHLELARELAGPEPDPAEADSPDTPDARNTTPSARPPD